MTDFARDFAPDYCSVCGGKILPTEPTKLLNNEEGLSHLVCWDDDNDSPSKTGAKP